MLAMTYCYLSLKNGKDNVVPIAQKNTQLDLKQKLFINVHLEYRNTKSRRITALITLLSQNGSEIKTQSYMIQ